MAQPGYFSCVGCGQQFAQADDAEWEDYEQHNCAREYTHETELYYHDPGLLNRILDRIFRR